MNRKQLVLILFISISLGCGKDKLDGNFDQFEGKWKWIHTLSRQNILHNWSSAYLNPNSRGYDAHVEFTNEGTIKFFVENKALEEVKYRIKDEIENEGNIELEIKIRGKLEQLELPTTLQFSLGKNDTMSFIGFPFSSYESSQYDINSGYFVRD